MIGTERKRDKIRGALTSIADHVRNLTSSDFLDNQQQYDSIQQQRDTFFANLKNSNRDKTISEQEAFNRYANLIKQLVNNDLSERAFLKKLNTSLDLNDDTAFKFNKASDAFSLFTNQHGNTMVEHFAQTQQFRAFAKLISIGATVTPLAHDLLVISLDSRKANDVGFNPESIRRADQPPPYEEAIRQRGRYTQDTITPNVVRQFPPPYNLQVAPPPPIRSDQTRPPPYPIQSQYPHYGLPRDSHPENHVVKKYGLVLGVDARSVDGTHSDAGWPSNCMDQIVKGIDKYANDPSTPSDQAQHARDIHNAFDYSNRYGCYAPNSTQPLENGPQNLANRVAKNDQITFIPTSCGGHQMGMSIVPDEHDPNSAYLVYTNKGLGCNPQTSGTFIYKVDPNKVDEQFIRSMMAGGYDGKKPEEITAQIQSIVDPKEPLQHIKQVPQKHGNCPVANTRSNVEGILLCQRANELPNGFRDINEQDKMEVKAEFKDFSNHMRNDYVQNLNNELRANPSNPDLQTIATNYLVQKSHKSHNPSYQELLNTMRTIDPNIDSKLNAQAQQQSQKFNAFTNARETVSKFESTVQPPPYHDVPLSAPAAPPVRFSEQTTNERLSEHDATQRLKADTTKDTKPEKPEAKEEQKEQSNSTRLR